MKVPFLKSHRLFRTNLIVSVILIGGFLLTAYLSQRTNYQDSLENIERISTLSMDGIYVQISSLLAGPVNIALTMAHDQLLVDQLEQEAGHLEDRRYLEKIRDYLDAYYKKYGFDTVFLVSTASGRYYNYAGLERIISEKTPENAWYYDFLASSQEYALNVDNDEAVGSEGETAIFVNCRVCDEAGKTIGVIGIGVRTAYLSEMLKNYEKLYNVDAFLINEAGDVQVSTTFTGYDHKNFFQLYHLENIKEKILGVKNAKDNIGLWATPAGDEQESLYIISRYIDELRWFLVVEYNTAPLMGAIRDQMIRAGAVLALIIVSILLIITYVIRNFNKNISEIIEQRQSIFKKATEQLYDHISEWNITANKCVGSQTMSYFGPLGAKNASFDECMALLAQKRIKPEFRDAFLDFFNRANILAEFAKGRNLLTREFMTSIDGSQYHWVRVDAHIFNSPDDDSARMFAYVRNIDEEKRKEFLSNIDEMTQCFTKRATERMIDAKLAGKPETEYAFFIFDIDNFKAVNDTFGHAFGDLCIKKFAATIKKHFREDDIVGRLGGDEFAAFIPVPDRVWGEAKAAELVADLDMDVESEGRTWHISASVGVALTHGGNFASVYKRADLALYHTKQNGKNAYTIGA